MLHADEVRVPPEVARRLIGEQFPQWRHLPVRAVAGDGTVHAVYRIGDDLAARFPLQGSDPEEVRERLVAQAGAARELARCCPVPTPEPVAIGGPGPGCPLPWSVQTWVPGRVAADDDPSGSVPFAHDLAAVIRALRAADTRGRRFAGTYRGGDLSRHDAWMRTCLRESEGLLDVERLRPLWRRFRLLPRRDADVLAHGDLVPGNVLVDRGRLVGLLDGDLFAPADPALDLVGAWHLLDDGPRAALRTALGCDDLQWARGMAWAFEQAMGLVWYYATANPRLSHVGRRTLARLLRHA